MDKDMEHTGTGTQYKHGLRSTHNKERMDISKEEDMDECYS